MMGYFKTLFGTNARRAKGLSNRNLSNISKNNEAIKDSVTSGGVASEKSIKKAKNLENIQTSIDSIHEKEKLKTLATRGATAGTGLAAFTMNENTNYKQQQ